MLSRFFSRALRPLTSGQIAPIFPLVGPLGEWTDAAGDPENGLLRG